MNPRALYCVLAAAWGLLIGAVAGTAIHRAILGPAPWPAAPDWTLAALAGGIGLALLALGALAGWRIGARIAGATASTRTRARAAGYALLTLWLVSAAALLAAGDFQRRADTVPPLAASGDAGPQETAEQAIYRIDFFGWNDMSAVAGIGVRGPGQGAYRLFWQVTEPRRGLVLAEGDMVVEAVPSRAMHLITLDRQDLSNAFYRLTEEKQSSASAEQTLRLSARLVPVPGRTKGASPPAKSALDAVAPPAAAGAGQIDFSIHLVSPQSATNTH